MGGLDRPITWFWPPLHPCPPLVVVRMVPPAPTIHPWFESVKNTPYRLGVVPRSAGIVIGFQVAVDPEIDSVYTVPPSPTAQPANWFAPGLSMNTPFSFGPPNASWVSPHWFVFVV